MALAPQSPVDSTRTQEELASRALGGDKRALTELCKELAGPVFRLCLRMLGDVGEAQDATQEILVQAITHLSQFQARGRISTWVYTIASRHLLRARASRRERRAYSVAGITASIEAGLSFTEQSSEPDGDVVLLERELRWTCTQAMLLCLSREERLAVLLADVLGASATTGAEVCEVSAETFRKRLQRARARLKPLLEERCGLVRSQNACRCKRQVSAMQRHRALELDWAAQPEDVRARVMRANQQLEELTQAGALFALEPPPAPPEQLFGELARLFPELLT